ncbi:hypothetical protein OESDEN_07089 [Oesophagostomum dentatum]|uniref:Uncharacterized protein n=1 Tax=Oesophagostomum dentatum TaxID=61180 RepID=A0A0B1TB29_OESDE|nr:hypothetical protein OESDEN_07089 [Oesophagostomum dentatum]
MSQLVSMTVKAFKINPTGLPQMLSCKSIKGQMLARRIDRAQGDIDVELAEAELARRIDRAQGDIDVELAEAEKLWERERSDEKSIESTKITSTT